MTNNTKTNLTIEELCEELNIKGLVNYTESEKYLQVKNYLYNKETGTIYTLD